VQALGIKSYRPSSIVPDQLQEPGQHRRVDWWLWSWSCVIRIGGHRAATADKALQEAK
jgi:hypothetical protein